MIAVNAKSIRVIVFLAALALPCAAGISCEPATSLPPASDSDTDTDADTDTDTDADSDTDTDTDTGQSTEGCQAVDLLFIIDDSNTMETEQQMLVDSFPDFIAVLEEYETVAGTQLDYRLGVTTTGISVHYSVTGIPTWVTLEGKDGELLVPDGSTDPWIDGPGANVESDFTDLAQVGIYGPAYEMPLYAMQKAIEKSGTGGPNDGFLRDDALFVAIFITDEDDCSRVDDYWALPDTTHSCFDYPVEHNLTDPATFKSMLDTRFGGEEKYAVVVIAGQAPPDGSAPCDYGTNGAISAGRLESFLNDHINASGQHGLMHDMCEAQLQGNMVAALENAMDLIEVACDDFIIE